MSLKWLQNLEADLKSWLTKIEGDAETAGKKEAALVATSVASVVPQLADAEVANLVNGTPSQSAAVAAKILTGAAADLESKTAAVGISTLLTGVQQTVDSVKATAASLATSGTGEGS